MGKIIGPITFAKGKELPKKLKDYIEKNGAKMPFSIDKFDYKNKKLDSWLRVKVGKKKYKYDRTNEKWEQDISTVSV